MATTSQTGRILVLIKPGAVERRLTGEILRRIEAKGYTLTALKVLTPTEQILAQHYAEHVDKPFYPGVVEYMTSGNVVAAVAEGQRGVEGPDVDVIDLVGQVPRCKTPLLDDCEVTDLEMCAPVSRTVAIGICRLTPASTLASNSSAIVADRSFSYGTSRISRRTLVSSSSRRLRGTGDERLMR